MALTIAFVALLLIFAALRWRYSSPQSFSSSIFVTMLVAPIAVYLSALLIENLSGRGTGLYAVVAMGVALGGAFLGLVGLMFNGLARLLRHAKSQQGMKDMKVRPVLRGIASVLSIAGAALAYIIWPINEPLLVTEIFTLVRMATSIAVAAWFFYLSRLLWV